MFGAEKTLPPDRETKDRDSGERQHPTTNAEIHQRKGSFRALDDRGLIGVMRPLASFSSPDRHEVLG